ncbi:MAG: cytidine deaminase [Anaerovoracaceae bacterium]
MTDKDLYLFAKGVISHAYAPYSGLKVGAALLSKTGQVFTGVNVENASFGATICAERTAFLKAVSEGFRGFSAIAIASSKESEAIPCGICLQFMSEFEEDLRVIVGPDEDNLKVTWLSKLLPERFQFIDKD